MFDRQNMGINILNMPKIEDIEYDGKEKIEIGDSWFNSKVIFSDSPLVNLVI